MCLRRVRRSGEAAAPVSSRCEEQFGRRRGTCRNISRSTLRRCRPVRHEPPRSVDEVDVEQGPSRQAYVAGQDTVNCQPVPAGPVTTTSTVVSVPGPKFTGTVLLPETDPVVWIRTSS